MSDPHSATESSDEYRDSQESESSTPKPRTRKSIANFGLSVKNSLGNLLAPTKQTQPSQAVPSQLALPTPLHDDLGFEEPLEEGEEHEQEELDQSRYTQLGAQLDEIGWLSLVKIAYQDEKLAGSSYIKGRSEGDWIQLADQVLSTVEPAVVKAICMGYLPELHAKTPKIEQILASYAKRGEEQPSVYIRVLVQDDNSFNSLTITQARNLVVFCKQYANQVDDRWKEAYKVDKAYLGDKWHHKDSEIGRRHFIEDRQGRIHQSKKRVMLTFARVLERNTERCNKEGRQHVPYLSYVGYAINATARKKQHDAMGDSTNWLVVFVLMVFKMWQIPVKMVNYTIVLITEKWGGPVAEMLITRLARAYYYSGGFSIGQAGASMNSIEMLRKTEKERADAWTGHINWVSGKTNYKETCERELELRLRQQRKVFDETKGTVKNTLKLFETQLDEMVKLRDALEKRADLDTWRTVFPAQYDMLLKFYAYVEARLKEKRDQRH